VKYLIKYGIEDKVITSTGGLVFFNASDFCVKEKISLQKLLFSFGED
jgi:hypothetical protein